MAEWRSAEASLPAALPHPLPLVDGLGQGGDDDDDIGGRAVGVAGLLGAAALAVIAWGAWNFFGSSAKASAQSEQSVAVEGQVGR